jgi:hypothetical protein
VDTSATQKPPQPHTRLHACLVLLVCRLDLLKALLPPERLSVWHYCFLKIKSPSLICYFIFVQNNEGIYRQSLIIKVRKKDYHSLCTGCIRRQGELPCLIGTWSALYLSSKVPSVKHVLQNLLPHGIGAWTDTTEMRLRSQFQVSNTCAVTCPNF